MKHIELCSSMNNVDMNVVPSLISFKLTKLCVQPLCIDSFCVKCARTPPTPEWILELWPHHILNLLIFFFPPVSSLTPSRMVNAAHTCRKKNMLEMSHYTLHFPSVTQKTLNLFLIFSVCCFYEAYADNQSHTHAHTHPSCPGLKRRQMMRMKWHKGRDKIWGKKETEPDDEKAARSDKKKIDIIKSYKRHKADGERDGEKPQIQQWVREEESNSCEENGFKEIYGARDKNKDLSERQSDRGKLDRQLWKKDWLEEGIEAAERLTVRTARMLKKLRLMEESPSAGP